MHRYSFPKYRQTEGGREDTTWAGGEGFWKDQVGVHFVCVLTRAKAWGLVYIVLLLFLILIFLGERG